MPNWCMNNLVIEGHKKDVEAFRKLLLTWTCIEYVHSDFGKSWLGNVVLGAGFLLSKGLEQDDNLYCRGWIDSIGDVVDGKDGISSFTVEYESAWKPLPNMWKAVMQKHAPYCALYWFATEPGSDVYQTNDISKKHFDTDYYVDSYLEDSKNPLYKDFQEAREFTEKELKEVLTSLFGQGPLKKLIQKAEKVDLGDGEWFSIHKMRCVL